MSERLQKFLASAGLGSRRQIEDWIRQRRIVVNGQPAQLGLSVSNADRIEIDGQDSGRACGQGRIGRDDVVGGLGIGSWSHWPMHQQ